MNSDSVKLTPRDWGFFGLRWVALVFIALMFLLQNNTGNGPGVVGNILVTFFIGGVLNIAFLVLAFYPNFRRAIPVLIVVGDWVLAGLYFGMGFTQPLVGITVSLTLILMATIQINYLWCMLHVVGIIGVFIGSMLLTNGGAPLGPDLSTPLALLVGLGVMAIGMRYVIEKSGEARNLSAERESHRTKMLMQAMQDRNRVMTDMTVALSSTLNPDKVLEIALDAGQYGMKINKRDKVITAALLFREDGALHVATAHGLTRNDMDNIVPGQAGLLGRALKDCEPVFGTNAQRDPELQYFAGLQKTRSLLCIPLHANYDNFGVLVYGSEESDVFKKEETEVLMAIGTQATIALHNAVLYRNLAEEKERIVDVEEDARKKLARDLHDGPTQNVSAIAMRMSYIYRLLERRPEEVPAELKKVEELARKTTKEIRDMLFTLRPLVLESQGLDAALEQLCQKTLETHGQKVTSQVGRGVEDVLDSQQQGVIFYIVEEAVGNARKHAEAELISIDVQRQSDVVVVDISDNGVGFDADAVNSNYDQRGSLGMVNMRERTELLDGRLRIDSTEGNGTTITIVVPIKEVTRTVSKSKSRQSKSNSRQMLSPRT